MQTKTKSLKVANLKPDYCKSCILFNHGTGFSHPEGLGTNGVLVVAEALGYNEEIAGLPLRPDAESGSVFERAIQQLGYNRNQFVIFNTVNCKPLGNKLEGQPYEIEAINTCSHYVDLVVNRFKPKVIFAMGNIAFKAITGLKGKGFGIDKTRGYFFKNAKGYTYKDSFGIDKDVPVIGSYHCSFLRRGNMKLFNLFCKDLSKAVAAAQGRLIEGRDFYLDPSLYVSNYLPNHPSNGTGKLNYNTNPSIEEAQEFLQLVLNNPHALIAYDIETEKSATEAEDDLVEFGTQISQIQFSIAKGSGIAFPYVEPFITIAKAIMATFNPKAGANVYKFDNIILKANGFVINGKITDTMWLIHHVQADLPLHLQACASYVNFPFAWKHMASSDLAFYGICDVDSVQWIMEQLPKDLDRLHLRQGYETYVESFYPILEQMTARGIPVNVDSLEALSKQVKTRQVEIQIELDSIVPEGLKKVLPTKDGYKVLSKETKALIERLTEEWQQAINPIPIVTKCYNCFGTGIIQTPSYTGKDFVEELSIASNVSLVITNDVVVEAEPDKVCSKCGGTGTFAIEYVETDRSKQARLSTLEQWIEANTKDKNGIGLVKRLFAKMPSKKKGETVLASIKVTIDSSFNVIESNVEPNLEYRYCRIEPFSAMSPPQVAKLIAHLGHTALAKKVMAKLYKAGEITEEEKTPTNKEVLRKLAKRTGEKVYDLIVEFRELTKIQGTFIEGWQPREIWIDPNGIKRGRVYPQFSFRPATLQLSSYSPNSQQISKHSDLGKLFRKCIEAYPGRTIVTFDYSGFHAKMMGYLSEDEKYTRLTGIDIHSYVAGHIVKYKGIDTCLDLSDNELKDYLAQIKKEHKGVRDKRAKPIILGLALGLTPNGCYERYKDDFDPSMKEVLDTFRKKPTEDAIDKRREILGKRNVKLIYAVVQKLFPKIFEWQEKTAMLAYKQGYLQIPYGARRWFHEVKKVKYKANGSFWEAIDGQQKDQALAYPIQANSHCHYREGLKMLEEDKLLGRYNLINLVHDEYVFEVPDELLEECISRVTPLMERESSTLKGFSCKVECQSGLTLADLKG